MNESYEAEIEMLKEDVQFLTAQNNQKANQLTQMAEELNRKNKENAYYKQLVGEMAREKHGGQVV